MDPEVVEETMKCSARAICGACFSGCHCVLPFLDQT